MVAITSSITRPPCVLNSILVKFMNIQCVKDVPRLLRDPEFLSRFRRNSPLAADMDSVTLPQYISLKQTDINVIFPFSLKFPKSYPSPWFLDLNNTYISNQLNVYCIPIRLILFNFTNDIIIVKQ